MAMSLIGRRLGNYDIQSKIGEGGMGLVYLGIHPQIGKKVAVKVLHEELCSKADVVARFFNEAKAVNDISHPNIVDIIDFGETTFDGVICKYIIMEYLDGESLAARMRREGVSIRETLHILAQCASALAASGPSSRGWASRMAATRACASPAVNISGGRSKPARMR